MISADLSVVAVAINDVGSDATLRRPTTTGPVTVAVKAVERSYRPDEMTGGIIQGDRQVIVSNIEIAAAAWPGPPQRGDQYVARGHTATVQGCESRNVANVDIMHVMQVRG